MPGEFFAGDISKVIFEKSTGLIFEEEEEEEKCLCWRPFVNIPFQKYDFQFGEGK